MALAKKCDFCNTLYEPYNVANNSKQTNGLMFLNIDSYQEYYSHGPYDCCPACMIKIRDFIANLSKNEEK